MATGDLQFFFELWKHRAHMCEVTGKPLPCFSPAFFAHVLSKKAYPRFRFYPKCIVIMQYTLHVKMDNFAACDVDPRFSWIKKLKEQLKYEYYNTDIDFSVYHPGRVDDIYRRFDSDSSNGISN
jgi:hypothetical protein